MIPALQDGSSVAGPGSWPGWVDVPCPGKAPIHDTETWLCCEARGTGAAAGTQGSSRVRCCFHGKEGGFGGWMVQEGRANASTALVAAGMLVQRGSRALPSPALYLNSESKHNVAKIQDKAVEMQALMSAVG